MMRENPTKKRGRPFQEDSVSKRLKAIREEVKARLEDTLFDEGAKDLESEDSEDDEFQ